MKERWSNFTCGDTVQNNLHLWMAFSVAHLDKGSHFLITQWRQFYPYYSAVEQILCLWVDMVVEADMTGKNVGCLVNFQSSLGWWVTKVQIR